MVGKEYNAPILAGVVGWPVSHSLSPLIHGEWAKRAGITGRYVQIPVESEYDEFARAMDDLKSQGLKGVNVTIPHKEHALRYADLASDVAKRVGAANMLTFGEKTYAENSDVIGFETALGQQLGMSSGRTSALILGAGGAARGVAAALRNIGFLDIEITNRTREKAEIVAALFGMGVIDWEKRNERLPAASVVVNTTSLGMTGQPPLELDWNRLRPGAIVADIVYSPLQTPLLKAAINRGHLTIDGLAMLMHQAVPGFKAWFGGDAVVDDDLRAILVAALKKQGRA